MKVERDSNTWGRELKWSRTLHWYVAAVLDLVSGSCLGSEKRSTTNWRWRRDTGDASEGSDGNSLFTKREICMSLCQDSCGRCLTMF